MEKEFISAIEQICEERGIAKEKVLETIEMAIAAAYKKEHGRKGQNVRAQMDLETGKAKLFQVKLVVEESMLKPEPEEGEEETEERLSESRPYVTKQGEIDEEIPEEERKIRFNPEKHIMLEEAQKTDKKLKAGDEFLIPLEADEHYGRIAAQTAKQVIIQRIREAEKEAVFEEYKEREGQVLSGIVQRAERGNIIFDLGRGSGVLPQEEQIAGEYYQLGQRFRLYLFEVQKGHQGSVILLSRIRPEMISRLFEIEVPEIAAGTVVIKGIAREAGSRSKIAVVSTEERIDPIGSLVGQKGTRVQAVINELGGEKVDIIQWDENAGKFVSNSLSPAKVIDVDIYEKERKAVVKVPEDQLSLAIGKRGQNVRLAAKLTGWKIDIVPAKGKVADAEKAEEGVEKTAEKSVPAEETTPEVEQAKEGSVEAGEEKKEKTKEAKDEVKGAKKKKGRKKKGE